MPYDQYWVPPDIAVVHRGSPVYHTYKNDEYDCINEYWYTLDPGATEDDGLVFDIREFPIDGLDPNDPADHPAILRRLLEDPAWLEDWLPEDVEPLAYRLQCPHCGAENPGIQVVAATFRTGPFVTTGGVVFTPDDHPETVTVQCRACHATMDLSTLKAPVPDA